MQLAAYGAVVRARRKRLGLSQRELAERVGCATVTVKRIEAGSLRPSRPMADRLARMLGMSDEERERFTRLAREQPTISAMPTAPALAEGDLRGYSILRTIGVGPDATVYEALQPGLRRVVALKLYHADAAARPELVRTFDAALRRAARLEHPHIVPVYDFWRGPGLAAVTTRVMRGGSLAVRLQAGPHMQEAALRTLDQIGAALTSAHRAGVAHGRLAPENVLFDEHGNAYVADFAAGASDQAGVAEGVRLDISALATLLAQMLEGGQRERATGERAVGWDELPVPLRPVLARALGAESDGTYPDIAAFVSDVYEAVRPRGPLREAAPSLTRAAAAATTNPFKGLRAFAEEDADDFFGRASCITRLLGELAAGGPASRFLAIVAPSGAGKSSVVQAGVIPALRRGALPGSEHWFVAQCTPGGAPIERCARAVADQAVERVPAIHTLAEGPADALAALAQQILPPDPRCELVLVVDQLEELFTHGADEATWRRTLDLLAATANAPRSRVRVVVTLRADFCDRPLQHAAFGALMRERTAFVVPMTAAELERAIAQPCARAGLQLEPGLLTQIVSDVADRPATLPLLQYALTELYERREGSLMTLAAYEAAGGISGAIARRAEQLYAGLDSAGRSVAERLFLQLVIPGEGDEDTRRRIPLAEAGAGDGGPADGVLAVFGRHRLLTFDRDGDRPTVELAHEALLRSWDRLAGWIDERRGELRLQRQLMLAAEEWERHAREVSFLVDGTRLAQLEGLLQSSLALSDLERDFLAICALARDARRDAERAMEETLRENLAQSEALRLAAEANRLLSAGGNAELIALLALRSLALRYTFQGDEALCGAALLDLPVQIIAGHAGRIYGAAIAPDAATAVTGGQDRVIRRWDVRTGVLLAELVGHTENVRFLGFSPDGRLLFSCDDGQTNVLWRMPEGRRLAVVRHAGRPRAASFSRDGRAMLTCGLEPTIQVLDTETLQIRTALDQPGLIPTACCWGADPETALVADKLGRVHHWDIARGNRTVLGLQLVEASMSLRLSRDGRRLLTSHADHHLACLWDLEAGTLLQRYEGHADLVHLAIFTADERCVVTSSNDGTVRVWETETGRQLRVLAGHTNIVWAHDCAVDGRTLLTAGTDAAIRIWDLSERRRTPLYAGHRLGVGAACFTPDGRAVVSACEDGGIHLWSTDGTAAREIGRQLFISMQGGIACTSDGQIVTGSDDGVLRVWETGGGVRELRGHGMRIWGVAVSADGRRYASASSDRTGRVWDAASGECLMVLIGHTDLVVGVAFSPDGERIATGSDDGTVRVWSAERGEEVLRLSDPHGPMMAVAFSPDGRLLLTGSGSGLVRLWDLADGAELHQLVGHTAYVNTVAFSPDGRLALTASSDRLARIWDVATGREVRRLGGHRSSVTGAQFSPDGRQIVTASADGTARVWHTDYQETAQLLAGRLLRDFTAEERAEFGVEQDLLGQRSRARD